MWPTVQYVVESVKNKSFTAVDLKDWSMMTKGGAYLAPYHNWDTKLAQDVKDLVEKKKNEIIEGLLRVVVDENTPKSD